MEIEASVATRFAAISPHLNERQRRLWVGSEARALGRGGVSLVARATGISRPTVHKALEELDAPPLASWAGTPTGWRPQTAQHYRS